MAKESAFIVRGMDCSDEVVAIRSALANVQGVLTVEANLMTSSVVISYEGQLSEADFIRSIESTGVSVEKQSTSPEQSLRRIKKTIPLGISGLFLFSGLLFRWLFVELNWLGVLFFMTSVATGMWLVLPKAWRALRSRILDMNILMCIATLGAVVIGEYAEAAAVVFLFALAEYLEGFSLDRARKSIQSLLKLVPETALLKKGKDFEEVPIDQVKVGDVILVRSGSRIPLDGEVLEGQSSVNQAPITGESLPVERGPGSRVLAGTINGEGSLQVRVTQGAKDTKLAQIIRLIEEAQKQKAPTERFVDTFAKYYTPAVLVIALGVFVFPPLLGIGSWQVWFYRSLVLLVIACPCALVIATPVSIVSGLTAMARRGVLLKGGASLEAMGKIRVLAVDKTGTITEGVPRVLQIHTVNGHTKEKVLAIAAAIDVHSTHPLAKAVVAKAREDHIPLEKSIGYQAVNGRGAEAVINGHLYFVGNHHFAHDNSICSEEIEKILESLEDQAQSVVVVGHKPHAGCPGEIMGVLGLGDAIRSDAKEAIALLHRVGIEEIVMLSGDNQRTVDAISRQVGLDKALGDLLPNDKVLRVKELKDRYSTVAMIGDGVNDAPAMASATLGIAMGASGTDTAIETADVTLMQDRLGAIAEAIQMGKKTLRVIWFNTGFALATKLLFLILSVLGFTSLWLAIAADTGATLLVIANALRLIR